MPQCPSCEHELIETDYFGRFQGFHLGEAVIERAGGIYGCPNEDCELHEEILHDHDDDRVEVGHPC